MGSMHIDRALGMPFQVLRYPDQPGERRVELDPTGLAEIAPQPARLLALHGKLHPFLRHALAGEMAVLTSQRAAELGRLRLKPHPKPRAELHSAQDAEGILGKSRRSRA